MPGTAPLASDDGDTIWTWPPAVEGDIGMTPPGDEKPENGTKVPRLWLLLACFTLVLVLGGSIPGIAVLKTQVDNAQGQLNQAQEQLNNVQKQLDEARSSSSTPIIKPPIIDLGCSAGIAATTFIPKFYDRFIYPVHCDRDLQKVDILDIFSPSFEACIQSCASQRSRAELSNATQLCEGVTFVPDWVNITVSLAADRGGNCFFKQGPLSIANLRPYDLPGEPLAHSAMVGTI
jgi:hypothetical protein